MSETVTDLLVSMLRITARRLRAGAPIPQSPDSADQVARVSIESGSDNRTLNSKRSHRREEQAD